MRTYTPKFVLAILFGIIVFLFPKNTQAIFYENYKIDQCQVTYGDPFDTNSYFGQSPSSPVIMREQSPGQVALQANIASEIFVGDMWWNVTQDLYSTNATIQSQMDPAGYNAFLYNPVSSQWQITNQVGVIWYPFNSWGYGEGEFLEIYAWINSLSFPEWTDANRTYKYPFGMAYYPKSGNSQYAWFFCNSAKIEIWNKESNLTAYNSWTNNPVVANYGTQTVTNTLNLNSQTHNKRIAGYNRNISDFDIFSLNLACSTPYDCGNYSVIHPAIGNPSFSYEETGQTKTVWGLWGDPVNASMQFQVNYLLPAGSYCPSPGNCCTEAPYTDCYVTSTINSNSFEVFTVPAPAQPAPTPPPPPVCSMNAPTNVSCVQEGNSIRVTWTDNSTNETAFVINRSNTSNAGPWIFIQSPGTNQTSYLDSNNLIFDNNYWYKVKSQVVNEFGTVVCESALSASSAPCSYSNPQTPWMKTKNNSFQTGSSFTNPIPAAASAYDSDDTGAEDYFITGSGGMVSAPTLSLAEFNATAKPSQNDWSTINYNPQTNLTRANYLSYIKSRKTFKTITDLTGITEDNIYYYDGDLTVGSLPNFNFVLVVNGAVTTGTNDLISAKSIAIMANSITVDANVEEIDAVLITDSFDTGTATTGLKIKGNLITNALTMNRTQPASINNKPSMFVVMNPKTYIDLLPYLAVSKYEWEQTQ